MEEIKYADFAKVEFKIGEIIEAVKVVESDKLIRMRVDFGNGIVKTVFSGIFAFYTPEELVGKKSVFVTNITPRKMMGERSEAMLFAAETEDGKTVAMLNPDKDIVNGSNVI